MIDHLLLWAVSAATRSTISLSIPRDGVIIQAALHYNMNFATDGDFADTVVLYFGAAPGATVQGETRILALLTYGVTALAAAHVFTKDSIVLPHSMIVKKGETLKLTSGSSSAPLSYTGGHVWLAWEE